VLDRVHFACVGLRDLGLIVPSLLRALSATTQCKVRKALASLVFALHFFLDDTIALRLSVRIISVLKRIGKVVIL